MIHAYGSCYTGYGKYNKNKTVIFNQMQKWNYQTEMNFNNYNK